MSKLLDPRGDLSLRLLDPRGDLSEVQGDQNSLHYSILLGILVRGFVTAKSLQSLHIHPLYNYSEHVVYSILKGGTFAFDKIPHFHPLTPACSLLVYALGRKQLPLPRYPGAYPED